MVKCNKCPIRGICRECWNGWWNKVFPVKS